MVDWSGLPCDLLGLVVKRLCLEDFLAFGAVCRSWRLAADKNNFEPWQKQPPWLMLANRKNERFREFFSLTTRKIYKFKIQYYAHGNKCLASQGWLFAVGKSFDINLLHPLSGSRVPLPKMHTLKDSHNFIHKAILSSNNPNHDLRVAAIYGDGINKLVGFWKLGDETWKTIDAYPSCECHDLVYYKGKFYGIDVLARVWVFDQDVLKARVISTVPREFLPNYGTMSEPMGYFERFYLIESAGSLLIVSRESKHSITDYGTTEFRLFELEMASGVWERVESLGNRALFLGHNSSLSIQVTSKCGCKPDCIYFTDDCISSTSESRKGKDNGIYNMRNGKFEQHSCDFGNPAIWIQPTFAAM